MATYTFNDVKRKISENGLFMSDADMRLAERNPDAGMSLVNNKIDYNNATTDEMRALANRANEKVRSDYGGYSGGEDGSKFYLTSPTPSSFSEPDKPTYENKWSDKINSGYDKLTNYGSFSYDKPAPVYNDTYAGKRQELVNSIADQKEFSWSKDSDPAYQAYAKQYAREGKRAVDDTMAAASAQSGGMPSSYAVTAANQAGNYYSSQMADKIPELYENAYNRYLKEFQKQKEALAAVQGESQNEYDKYLSERSIYNNDRNFAYQQYADGYDRLSKELSTASALEQMDYSKYLDELGQFNNDRSFRYQQLLDTIANNQYNDEMDYQRANDAAGYGDYSFLNKLGVDTSKQEARDALADEYSRLQLGGEYAGYGDYGYLRGLGVDTSNAEKALAAQQYETSLQAQLLEQQIENAKAARNDDAYSRQLELAKLAASQGDFTPLAKLGIDVTEAKKAWDASYNAASGQQDYSIGDIYTAMAAQQSGKANAQQIDMLLAAGLLTPEELFAKKEESSGGYTQGQLYEAVQAQQNGKATADQYEMLIAAGLIDPNDLYKTDGGLTAETGEDYVPFTGGAPMSREEWHRQKNLGSSDPAVRDYATYDEYNKALLEYNMEGLMGNPAYSNILHFDLTDTDKQALYYGNDNLFDVWAKQNKYGQERSANKPEVNSEILDFLPAPYKRMEKETNPGSGRVIDRSKLKMTKRG